MKTVRISRTSSYGKSKWYLTKLCFQFHTKFKHFLSAGRGPGSLRVKVCFFLSLSLFFFFIMFFFGVCFVWFSCMWFCWFYFGVFGYSFWHSSDPRTISCACDPQQSSGTRHTITAFKSNSLWQCSCHSLIVRKNKTKRKHTDPITLNLTFLTLSLMYRCGKRLLYSNRNVVIWLVFKFTCTIHWESFAQTVVWGRKEWKYKKVAFIFCFCFTTKFADSCCLH